jgi:IS4 transposase
MESIFSEPDWAWVTSRLGSGPELERSARESGALVRRREIRDAGALLRLCLSYGCGLSLREASAWAELNGIATFSDVAVLKRLRRSADWLGRLAGAVVAERLPQAGEARPIRLVDASMVRAPDGALWRLHVAYDLAERRFTHVELTDHKGAERLERAPVAVGEIRIGDRCYARPEGVREFCAAGGDFLVRIGWKSLFLRRPDGSRLDLRGVLEDFSQQGPVEMPVHILNGRKRSLPAIPARLIIIRKAAEAAEHSRKRARKASRYAQPQQATLRAADFTMLVTSLDPTTYPTDEVTALYRLRWQVELAFKRLKSLLDFSKLPARDVDLAPTWLFAKLLMALLVEDLDQELLDSPPCAERKLPTALDMAARQDDAARADSGNPRRALNRHNQKPPTMVAAR